MTTAERAAKVLQQIDEQLALDQKATKGPWLATQARGPASMGQFEIQNYDGVRYNMLATLAPFGEDLNAAFIATARTGYPVALECLKTAIEGLMLIYKYGHPPHSNNDGCCPYGCDTPTIAERSLTTLIEKWEAGK